MPLVNGKHFPYSKEGLAAAKRTSNSLKNLKNDALRKMMDKEAGKKMFGNRSK